MQSLTITVNAAEGLHARPAHLFCAQATKSPADIQVRNVTTESGFVTAKSILMVLTLGVIQGHEIEITASGEGEEDAIESMRYLIENNFPEDE
jgi:phosphotransferase system HPr (HPr) family protein